ncbi:twin-arginine translocase TatA/TatE family subunit [Legionella anisa]|uniref:Preprotein translocase subunit TatB n=1 Tax=Legionella anisa TaxID=28082 RepID=A0AAX0X231_9GAMM|nr:twin-arginine translocase TatA/TatE family subunit [Legionella anisa]AWN72788.1 preprotein translocase subunit TatB [Legionella anisa]KTC70771.1 TatB protein (twin arginine translocation) [Legionella anisa]MBN5934740.1 twin-arginine translocase TatA/TatE family subunit [Legionella anisa]MCW8423583.1 twin-arginine translocase TatA/TatE family subunit [Legionella anisa]MCW8447103.1 twin-arginine translocase TatA/TatE family subunit [Legionella anisa]
MSGGELLVIFIVALIVFGPKKLPMLATHLGLLVRKLNQFKAQAAMLWQQQLNALQLQENQRKAKEADEQYKKEEQI